MALLQCQFFSESLQISASMNVILPQQKGRLFPTLYLLHGLSDDHTSWYRQTSIERYALSRGVAVVMPAVNRSFYTDMRHGAKYWTFISEEVPELARSFFPLSSKREDNFAAGLSMGGYGAMKWGLTHPDRFAAVASLSGVMNVNRWATERGGEESGLVFGDLSSIPGSSADLFALAEQVVNRRPIPLLFQCCGTEDFLYEDNTHFRDHSLRLGLPLTYEEEPGDHEWGYWDSKIRRVLEWLPIKN